MEKTKRTALCGVLTALAMVCSYIDNLIPVFSMVPGMKLGLANIVILVALFTMGTWEAVIINVLRVSLTGMLVGTFQSFMFSIGGAVLSLVVMIAIMRLEDKIKAAFGVKIAIVSELGAISHITGQLLVAGLFFAPRVLAYYSLYMYFCAVVCGVVISIPAGVIIRILQKNTFDMA